MTPTTKNYSTQSVRMKVRCACCPDMMIMPSERMDNDTIAGEYAHIYGKLCVHALQLSAFSGARISTCCP